MRQYVRPVSVLVAAAASLVLVVSAAGNSDEAVTTTTLGAPREASSPAADEPQEPMVTPTANIPGPPEIYWDNMVFDTVKIPLATLTLPATLPFPVVLPDLGVQPAHVDITNPTLGRAPIDVAAVLYYDLPAGHAAGEGRVVVSQRLTDQTGEDIRRIAAGRKSQQYAVKSIGDTTLMLIRGQGLGRVRFVLNGVMFDISGPTLTPEGALRVAGVITGGS